MRRINHYSVKFTSFNYLFYKVMTLQTSQADDKPQQKKSNKLSKKSNKILEVRRY